MLLVFCVHRGRLESLLMGVLSNKKSVAKFPGGDRRGRVRPSEAKAGGRKEEGQGQTATNLLKLKIR